MSVKSSAKFHGQYAQDKYCYEHFFKHKKEPGIFIELGACDGVRFSNTLFFERQLGWGGICIEPRTDAFEELTKNRSCVCVNTAIDTTFRESVDFCHISGYGKGLSGLVDKYDPKHVSRIEKEIKHPDHKDKNVVKVDCVPLQSLLDKYDMLDVDFLSLDTEGSELDILKSIDWIKTTIRVIAVENNYNDDAIGVFLLSKGYRFVTRIKCDEVYVYNV